MNFRVYMYIQQCFTCLFLKDICIVSYIDNENYVGRVLILDWLDRQKFVRRIQKLCQLMNTPHAFKRKINNLTQNKGQHLFWLFNDSSFWSCEMTNNINNLMNFAYVK